MGNTNFFCGVLKMVKDGKILVNEIFESIDGEGYHAGFPTVFFRVTGCNLRCDWCDSKYTFQAEKNSRWMSVNEALNEVEKYNIKHITITGGEPLLEENSEWMVGFISNLINNAFFIDIETNGSIDYSYWKGIFRDNIVLIMDWKCPSSKMNHLMLQENLEILSENDIVKMVVTDDDFDEVEKILKIGTFATIYISPVFGKVTMEKIPEFVLKHKNENLRCQIQMHKIFWNPDKRGV